MSHYDFPIPFNKELRELNLIPYRTNKELIDSIDYIFSHPYNTHNKLYQETKEFSRYNLQIKMGNTAVGVMRYFLDNPNQFGNSIDNIHMQILVRMWKDIFYFIKLEKRELDKYYSTKLKLLSIDNGFIDILQKTCIDKDYIQHYDDMVKRREGVGLRERKLGYSKEQLDYYDTLD
jgi:hypothetical protein